MNLVGYPASVHLRDDPLGRPRRDSPHSNVAAAQARDAAERTARLSSRTRNAGAFPMPAGQHLRICGKDFQRKIQHLHPRLASGTARQVHADTLRCASLLPSAHCRAREVGIRSSMHVSTRSESNSSRSQLFRPFVPPVQIDPTVEDPILKTKHSLDLSILCLDNRWVIG